MSIFKKKNELMLNKKDRYIGIRNALIGMLIILIFLTACYYIISFLVVFLRGFFS